MTTKKSKKLPTFLVKAEEGDQVPFSRKPFRACFMCKNVFPTTTEHFAIKRRKNSVRLLLESLCKTCVKIKRKNYKKKHLEDTRRWARGYHSKNRAAVLKHYGGDTPKCVCCGIDWVEFLAIDHINGGGNKHRKIIGGGHSSSTRFYVWLKNNNFPEGFQILCHNCNMAKGKAGICPHQIRKQKCIHTS